MFYLNFHLDTRAVKVACIKVDKGTATDRIFATEKSALNKCVTFFTSARLLIYIFYVSKAA